MKHGKQTYFQMIVIFVFKLKNGFYLSLFKNYVIALVLAMSAMRHSNVSRGERIAVGSWDLRKTLKTFPQESTWKWREIYNAVTVRKLHCFGTFKKTNQDFKK